MAIDVGYDFIDGSGDTDNSSGYTILNYTNPANATGTITQAEFYANTTNVTGLKIALFYEDTSAPVFSARSSATLGNFLGGARRTVTGLSLDVITGDYAGWYASGYGVLSDSGGGDATVRYYIAGDKTGNTGLTFTSQKNFWDLLYLTGTETATGHPYYYYMYQR